MASSTQVIDLRQLDELSQTTLQDCKDILTVPDGAWAYLVREVSPSVVSVTALHTPMGYHYTKVGDIAICPTLDQVAGVLLIWQV